MIVAFFKISATTEGLCKEWKGAGQTELGN